VAAKARCAAALRDAMPPALRKVYLDGGDDAMKQLAVVEMWLDVLADPYLNKHLVFRVVELLVVRLMPEIGEKGVSELLAERLDEKG